MTINSTANRASYVGNGVTTAFSFPYYFQLPADIVVLETLIATGAQTIRMLTADYSISGTQDANGFFLNGATITAVVAPPSTVTWSLYRDPARTQLVQHVDGDSMPAASIDGPLDKITTILQRHDDLLARALRQGDGDVVSLNTLPAVVTRANGGLGSIAGYDGTGQPTTLAVAASGVQTSVAMGPVITAATLVLARTNMGVPGLTDNNSFSGSNTFNGATTFNSPEGNAATLTLTGAALNETQATDLASATTTDIGAVLGNYVHVTGTTTITSLGTIAKGARRVVEFAGILTLTNNANIILPTGQSITTAAGDVAQFISEGAGVWRCVGYMRASGASIVSTAVVNSLAADVALNNVATYFDGPSVAQGTVGTWIVSGTVTLTDTVAATTYDCKLWDGTTIVDSGETRVSTANAGMTISLSGIIINPAGNLRISVKPNNTTSKMLANQSGNAKDSTITAVRVG